MRTMLIALALGAAGLASAAPADAQPGYGRHYGYGRGHDRGYRHRWVRTRDYPAYRGHYNGRRSYGRGRYGYYRHGHRYYGYR